VFNFIFLIRYEQSTAQKSFYKCRQNNIAGHYRNNPWPAVPDWRQCRNADAGLYRRTNGKTNDAGLTFSPAFRHSGISIFLRLTTFHLCEYCVFPGKIVAPPFHYVEKGDENDVAISCSVSATLFFCFVKQEAKFRLFRETKFRLINIKISRNTKWITSRNFVSRNFIDHPKPYPFPFLEPETLKKTIFVKVGCAGLKNPCDFA
jgi:hypothetical protein